MESVFLIITFMIQKSLSCVVAAGSMGLLRGSWAWAWAMLLGLGPTTSACAVFSSFWKNVFRIYCILTGETARRQDGKANWKKQKRWLQKIKKENCTKKENRHLRWNFSFAKNVLSRPCTACLWQAGLGPLIFICFFIIFYNTT